MIEVHESDLSYIRRQMVMAIYERGDSIDSFI